jgi:drug/metabolite transporter (DMT)-like permease
MDCGDGSSRDVCDQFFIEVMAMKMTDLRFIIGLFFTFCGVVLVATSFFGASDLVEGFRMNLDSGLLMLVFGLFMLTLSVLSTQNTD